MEDKMRENIGYQPIISGPVPDHKVFSRLFVPYSMKRNYDTQSTANANNRPPGRKRTTNFREYIPGQHPAAPVAPTVELITVKKTSRSGRFGVRRRRVIVTVGEDPQALDPIVPVPDLEEVPAEDPAALDASLWEDMLGDDVVCTVKRKRKQRNDSVSKYNFLTIAINLRFYRRRCMIGFDLFARTTWTN